MTGSSKTGLALVEAVEERALAGQLERDLVGVDVVELAVVDLDA